MSESEIKAYHVEYEDNWLGVTDFATIKAENEENAREKFNQNHRRDDNQDITSVEVAYSISIDKIQMLSEEIGQLEI